jgi:hypothetical protein
LVNADHFDMEGATGQAEGTVDGGQAIGSEGQGNSNDVQVGE